MRDRDKPALPNWLVGILAVVCVVAAAAYAFAGELPWSGGHQVRAAFPSVQGMNTDSPVRVAGVDVGEVTEIEHLAGAPGEEGAPAGASVVTMELSEEGLPLRSDATLRIRPRLFLEGNYFVELRPGSPSAPRLAEGEMIPYTNTSFPVQLDEVLTGLPSEVRGELQDSLDELSGALVDHGGAEGLRELARTSGGAAKHTAIVNEALLGTEPGDLSGLIRNLGRVTEALGRNEPQLQGLVVNLNAVAGALAAENTALERAIADLPATLDAAGPTLEELNASLPPARALARESLPGFRALTPAVDAATPLLRELRGLVSRPELRGAVAELRPALPHLAKLTARTTSLLDEARALSSCFNEIVIPWSRMTVPDPETPATGEVHEETSYGLVGISGESRSFDANGPYARVLVASGSNLVVLPALEGTSDQVVGLTPFPILGARPALDSSAKTPFRRDVACESNDPPDLDSGQAAPAPEQRQLDGPAGAVEPTAELRDEVRSVASRLERADGLAGRGGDAARRAKRLNESALADLERSLAEALGWQNLLEEGSR